ncbi:MAG: YgiQ family radical SAM protein [Bacteroidales bacterium]
MTESRPPITAWLPMSLEEAAKRGWDSFDIILVTGDAYVDHPSFGTAIIGRVLEKLGYRVGIIAQPNWRDDLRDFKKLGQPSLFFGVSAGNMDSMVNHYTAMKRLRSDDAYTPGGVAGFRPDYASVVYTQKLKQLFPETPVVLGGVEASMRRATHYDYWSDSVMPSVLLSSGADILLYGMAEKAITAVAAFYRQGAPIEARSALKQVSYLETSEERISSLSQSGGVITLPSHEACVASKKDFAEAFRMIETESNRMEPATLIQPSGTGHVVITPPFPAPEPHELDKIYAFPYTRQPHPRYRKRGDVPAWGMIRDSVTIHRGCFGGCSFCTISMHQGKFISSRSEESIISELEELSGMDDFKGTVTDLGGPSANMYRMRGSDLRICRKCSRPSCLWPQVCNNLNMDHGPLIALYRKAKAMKKVKHLYVGSGIRYDMLTGVGKEKALQFRLKEYTAELIRHHVSGRLKVAPEHADPKVLQLIRKPSFDSYLKFRDEFVAINRKHGLRQQLIPYLIASLPGCTMQSMGNLTAAIAPTGARPEQVQDFTPTPMTLSTTMYYTGINPYSSEPVYIPGSEDERRNQRKFFFWYKPENRDWIVRTLRAQGQGGLIRMIYRDHRK